MRRLLLLSLLLMGCTKGKINLNELGLTNNDFSITQGSNDANFKINGSSLSTTFTIHCDKNVSELHVSLDQSQTFEKLQDIDCHSGETTVTYTFPTDFSNQTVYFKGKGLELETKIISVNFIKPVFDNTTLSVKIENDAALTKTLTVGLTLNASILFGTQTELPQQVYITETAGCSSGGQWMDYATSITGVVLSNANATNTIYAKFRDDFGNESNCVSDDILHDGIAPVGVSLIINSNQLQANVAAVTLAISATGDKDKMMIYNSADCTGTAVELPYAATANWTLTTSGPVSVSANFKDLAGNVSNCVTDDIIYDTSPPVMPTSITLGAGIFSTDNDDPVTVIVSPVLDGDTAKLYSDSTCTTELGTSVGANNSAQFSVGLGSDAVYHFWSKVVDPGNLTSACSTVSLTYALNTQSPTVLEVSSSTDDVSTKVTNDVVAVDVKFSEPVIVTGGIPKINLNLNGLTVPVSYSSGSGTDKLTFNYTVQANHVEDDLDYLDANALDLNGAVIADVTGNAADITLPVPASANSLGGMKNLKINSVTMVKQIYGPFNRNYRNGDTLNVVVVFNNPVTIFSGTSSIILKSGDNANDAGAASVTLTYAAATSTNTRFVYTGTISVTNPDYDGLKITGFSGTAVYRDIFNNVYVPTLTPTVFTGIQYYYSATVLDVTMSGVNSEFVNEPTFGKQITLTSNSNIAATAAYTATYRLLPLTSADSSDTNLISGEITIPAGGNTGSISFDILDDVITEGYEAFQVFITGSKYGRFAVSANMSKLYTISDDEVSPTIIQMVSGTNHTCVLFADGAMKCFGANADGQLGTGNFLPRSTPYEVFPAGSGVTQISAGGNATCAVKNSNLYCWGDGNGGRNGLGSLTLDVATPTQVNNLSSVVQVEMGDNFSCARYMASGLGKVKCWGYNFSSYMAFGDGTTSSRSAPISTPISTVTNALDLDVGFGHACVMDGTTMKCWGYNSSGQVGNGLTSVVSAPYSITPTANDVITKIVLVGETTCVIYDNVVSAVIGGVKCWGSDYNFQLGNNAPATNLYTYPATNIGTGYVSLAGVNTSYSTSYGICGVKSDNSLICWGNNANRTFPLLSFISYPAPTTATVSSIKFFSANTYASCVVNTLNKVLCGGATNSEINNYSYVKYNYNGPHFFGGTEIKSLSSSNYLGCVLFSSGEAQCQNYIASGFPGDGTTLYRNSPVTVAHSEIEQINVSKGSYTKACFIRTDKTLWCMSDSMLFSGDGTSISRYYPVYVSDDVEKVESGYNHTCFKTYAGALYCWGETGSGQVGNNDTVNDALKPFLVFASGVTDFTTGMTHTCAIVNAELYCWGLNSSSQVGDASGTNQPIPAEVLDIYGGTPVKVVAGADFTCALYQSSGLRCWGGGSYGQMGRGSTSNKPIPGDDLLTNVHDVYANMYSACAKMNNGDLKCWGRNTNYTVLGQSPAANVLYPSLIPTSIFDFSSYNHFMMLNGSGNGNHLSGTICAQNGTYTYCWGENQGLIMPYSSEYLRNIQGL